MEWRISPHDLVYPPPSHHYASNGVLTEEYSQLKSDHQRVEVWMLDLAPDKDFPLYALNNDRH